MFFPHTGAGFRHTGRLAGQALAQVRNRLPFSFFFFLIICFVDAFEKFSQLVQIR